MRSGEIPERRIDRSVRRVLELKLRRGLFRNPFVAERKARRRLGTRAHRAAAARVGAHSVTLVKNDAGVLPLAAGRRLLVTGYRLVSDSTDARPAAHLAAALRRRGVRATVFETGSSPDSAVIDAAVREAGSSDAVVVATANASGSVAQRNLVDAMIRTGRPVVLVATRNPYDIAQLTQAPTYLTAYSWSRPAMQAVAGAARPDRAGREAAGADPGHRGPEPDAVPVRARPRLLSSRKFRHCGGCLEGLRGRCLPRCLARSTSSSRCP